MHRREFIVLLGGTAATWLLTARTDQLRLIGVLSGFSEEEMRPVLDAFRSRLNELGWIEGRNITIDARLGAGDYARLAEDAGTLVGRKPDVIVAMGTPGLTAIRQHTHSVSVVFALVADPVSAGLVESLARPGGHATGFTNFEFSIGGKWLELLKGICPSVTHVTVISNPANPATGKLAQFIGQAGRSAAIDITTASVKGSSEIEAAVITTAQEPESGLIVLPDSLIIVNSELIIALAERYRLPAVRFTLSSPAFNDNAMLPLKYAGGAVCGSDSQGGDISPPLAWSNPPAGTKSFAVLMIDPDGRRGIGSVHWVAYGIPAERRELMEGEGGGSPKAVITNGKNSRGTMGYAGPCGPPIDARATTDVV